MRATTLKIPNKVKRALRVDQSLQRYMLQLEGAMNQRFAAHWRLARVERETPTGVIEVLQIIDILETDSGLLIRVR
jgi:hypothetical protein